MQGPPADSFFTSPLYGLMLYSAMLPSAYFIAMVVGKIRHLCKMTVLEVLLRTFVSWILIMVLYTLCALLFGFSMADLGGFIDADTGTNPFVRYYPVAVLIIAVAGFYYPNADFFNINRTKSKRVLLLFVCFTPLYLMLVYMLFVKPGLWPLCLRFGFRSSLLAFTISFPTIFYDAPNGFLQAWNGIALFLFRINTSDSKNE